MNLLRSALSALLASALVGAGVGVAEATYVLLRGAPDLLAPVYAVVLYGLVGAGIGLVLTAPMVGILWWLKRRAADVVAPAIVAGCTLLLLGMVVLRYLLNRDYYLEQGVPLLGNVLALGLLTPGFLLVAGVRGLFLVPALRRFTTPATLLGAFGAFVVATGVLALVPYGDDPRAHLAGPHEEDRPDRPNVLLIMVDTLRADHVGAYGQRAISTPAMDSLAKEGVLFEHAFANASWTRASGASLLTSRLPSGHNAYLKSAVLPDEVETIGEVLSAGGMNTGALIDNINLSSSFHFDQGWDTFIYEAPDYRFGATESVFGLSMYKVVNKGAEKLSGKTKRVEHFFQPADVVLADAKAYVQANEGSDWALFVHLMEPHDPYFEHPMIRGEGSDEYNGVAYSRAEVENPDPSQAEVMHAAYQDSVQFLDVKLGPFFQWLKDVGQWDDTVIVLTADHGEEFQEHGGWWHGTTLYDEQIHVPLLVKLRGGARAGTRVSWQVRLIDVAPTLAAATGIPPGKTWEGRDLFAASDWPTEVPAIDPAAPVPEPSCDDLRHSPQDRLVIAEEDFEGNQLQAIRSSGFKYIRANAGNPRGLAEKSLFDIVSDPGEGKDLVGTGDSICGTYESDRLTTLDGALTDVLNAVKGHAATGAETTLTEAERQRLCALGYLQCD